MSDKSETTGRKSNALNALMISIAITLGATSIAISINHIPACVKVQNP